MMKYNEDIASVKLETIIADLCPTGVKYVTLGDVVSFTDGYSFNSSEFGESGDFQVVKITDIFDGKVNVGKTYISVLPERIKEGQRLTGGEIVVAMSGSTGKTGYNTLKNAIVNQRIAILRSSELVENGFLKHLLVNRHFEEYCFKNGTGPQNNIGKSCILKFRIPLPPLVVQREIVRILDNFTELTTELATELIARKKQYEYYRDSILPFGAAKKYLLGDVATIMRGASPRPIKSFITESENGVNWIKIGDAKADSKYISETKERITADGARKSRHVKPGDFILSNSMSFGRPYILKISGCIHDGWLSISAFEDKLSPDFLYHVLTSTYMQSLMRKKASFGGAVQNLNADIVRELEIPIPPLAEQERIAHILDHFDALCNDLTSGLPAEIEARQKQYEYYRDKLLSFKEASV